MFKFLFLFTLINFTSLHPIPANDFIFPDEIDDSAYDLRNLNQLRFLNDANILKSDNASIEFIKDDAANYLENGLYFQGDILLIQDQEDYLKQKLSDDDKFPSRTGVISETYRWPRNGKNSEKVIVPFEISDDYSYLDFIRIYLAMYDIEKYTCIEFKTRKNKEPDYLLIKPGNGCSSHLGKIGGRQNVTLQKKGCMSRGTIIHELIHALGYDHMHSDERRDKYIKIIWENIDKKHLHNFDKIDSRKFSDFGTDYDFHSVMHYNPTAFSKNGKRTILPKNEKYRNVIGQRVGMSKGDAERINNMYNCFK